MTYIPNTTSITSTSNSTTTPLSGSATYTGTGELNGFPDVMVSCQTDNSGTLYFDFSVDGSNWGTFPTNGFDVTANIHEFHTAVKGPRYFRVRLVNNSGDQSYLRLSTYYGNFDKPNAPIGQIISLDSDAIITKSVSIGQQPDGDFVNAPADGEVFVTSSTLSADSVFTSDWFDSDGWRSIELVVSSDVPSSNNGIEIQFTNDTQADTPTVVATKYYEYNASDVAIGSLMIRLGNLLDGYRVKYTNGSSSQSSFFLNSTLRVEATGPEQSIESTIGANTLSPVIRGVLAGKDPNGNYNNFRSTGTSINYNTPLTNGSSWDTGIIDMHGYTSIQFVTYGDQPITILNQWYNDALGSSVVDESSQTVSLNTRSNTIARDISILTPRTRYIKVTLSNNSGEDMTFTDFSATLHVTPPTSNQVSLSTRLRDGSLVSLNKAIIAGKDPDGVYQNVAISDSGALWVSDFLTEVVRSKISGHSIVVKFGLNNDIDSGPEDVWSNGGIYTGFPTTSPETIDVFSSSENDTSDGSGARTLRLEGLDDSWAIQTEDVTLSGTSQVTTSSTWRRLNLVYVLTAGSGGGNAGIITARNTTTTDNVFATIPIGYNQTQIAAYTIPAGKTGYLKSLYISLGRSNGSAGSAIAQLKVRNFGGTFRVMRSYVITESSPADPPFKIPLTITEKSDIKITIDSVSDANNQPTAEFELLLIDN